MMRRFCTLLSITGLGLAAPVFADGSSCDYNGDGSCDRADREIILAAFGTQAGDPGFLAAADHDGDGIISAVDLSRFVSLQKGS